MKYKKAIVEVYEDTSKGGMDIFTVAIKLEGENRYGIHSLGRKSRGPYSFNQFSHYVHEDVFPGYEEYMLDELKLVKRTRLGKNLKEGIEELI